MSLLHPQYIDETAQNKGDLTTFKNDLTKAIESAFPTGRMPYNRVRVALVHWDLDDIHAEDSVNEIQKVFQDYGYACRKYILQAQSATISLERSLQKILHEFGFAGEKGDLSIFYYAGRSIWDQRLRVLQFQYAILICVIFQSSLKLLTPISRSAPFHVAGTYGPVEKVARVDFTTQSRANLDSSDAAVLYLLDTCYTAGAMVDGNREVFAAAGNELPTDNS